MNSDDRTRMLQRSMVADQAGRGAIVSPYPRDNESPLAVGVGVVESALGCTIDLYWVEGGSPRFFCLPYGDRVAVSYATPYLVWAAALRQCFGLSELSDELRQRVAEQRGFLCAADVALADGRIELAIDCLAIGLANAGSSGLLVPPLDIDRLEREPLGASYFASWFFGLAHEAGHHVQARCATLDDASSALRSHIELAVPDDHVQEVLQEVDEAFLEQVVDEASADFFGAVGTWNTMVRVLGDRRSGWQGDLPLTDFIWETDIAVWTAGWLRTLTNQTSLAAERRATSGMAPSRHTAVLMLLDVFAVRARREILARAMPALIVQGLNTLSSREPDDDEVSGRLAGWSEVVAELHETVAPDIDFIGDGLERASRYLVGLEERDSRAARRDLLQMVAREPPFEAAFGGFLRTFAERARISGQQDDYLNELNRLLAVRT